MVLVDAELDLLGAGREAGELLERPGRDDRLEVGPGRLEGRLLHGEPVRVGRGHHELVALELDEDAGQDRARLVTRGGARDLLDRREERRRAIAWSGTSSGGSLGKSSAL